MSDLTKERLDRLLALQEELETILQTLVLNDSTIIDALAQMLGAIQQMQTQSVEAQNRLAENFRSLAQELARESHRGRGANSPVLISGSEPDESNPECGLLEHLYSYVDIPCAIDVGANVGDVAARLLGGGYTVYAFEPYQPAFAKLVELQKHSNEGARLHPSNCAIGAADGTMQLHLAANLGDGHYDVSLLHSLVKHPMPDDCQFTKSVPVQVRSLDSLRRSGEIPERAGLLKIDTEGLDLEVIRGMGHMRYPIVMTEFWDGEHPFGRAGHGSLALAVREMRARKYPWHLVIYHIDEENIVSFSSNRSASVPKSWGNAIFFRDHAAFAAGLRWCEEMLPPTLYR
jgi:FkbM family methyltransferase